MRLRDPGRGELPDVGRAGGRHRSDDCESAPAKGLRKRRSGGGNGGATQLLGWATYFAGSALNFSTQPGQHR